MSSAMSSKHSHGASLRDTFSNPNGDTLIYLENQLLDSSLQQPLRSSSSVLSSPAFRGKLGPTYQHRVLRRKKLLQNGLPMGVKFVIDLSPPSEGDEAVEVTEKLWCPESVRQWKTSEEAVERVYLEPDNGYYCTETPVDIPESLARFYDDNWGNKAGTDKKSSKPIENSPGYDEIRNRGACVEYRQGEKLEYYDFDFLTPFDLYQAPPQAGGPTEERPPSEGDKIIDVKRPVWKKVTWKVPPEYSIDRHIAAVERVIGILNGVDPHIYSATMWYTVYKVAVMLECTTAVVDYIVRWLYDGNQAFIELFTPLVMGIANDIQAECLLHECFALIVSREVVHDQGGLFYQVEYSESIEKWRKSTNAAQTSLQCRIRARWERIFNFESWLRDPRCCPHLAALRDIIDSPQGTYSPEMIAATQGLSSYIENMIKGRLRCILVSRGQIPHAPPAPPPSVDQDVWDRWRDRVFKSCAVEEVRLFNRYVWTQIRDIDLSVENDALSVKVEVKAYLKEWRKAARHQRSGIWTPPVVKNKGVRNKGKGKMEYVKLDSTSSIGGGAEHSRKRSADMSEQDITHIKQSPAQKRTTLEVRPTPLNMVDLRNRQILNQHNQVHSEYGPGRPLLDECALPGGWRELPRPDLPRPRPTSEWTKAIIEAFGSQSLHEVQLHCDSAPPITTDDGDDHCPEDLGSYPPPFPTYTVEFRPPKQQNFIEPDSSIAPSFFPSDLRLSEIMFTLPTPSTALDGTPIPTSPIPTFKTNSTLEIRQSLVGDAQQQCAETDRPNLPLVFERGGFARVGVNWYEPPVAKTWQYQDALKEAEDYVNTLAVPMCDNALGWEFMNFQLLTCLTDEEFQYLPTWAGGLDDGTGAVFGEEESNTWVGAGETEGSEEGDTDDGASTVSSYSIVNTQSTGEILTPADGMSETTEKITWSEVDDGEVLRSAEGAGDDNCVKEWEEEGDVGDFEDCFFDGEGEEDSDEIMEWDEATFAIS